MILKELTDHLEALAPLKYQEPYDNAGLLVGDPAQEINGVMVSLDCIPEVIQEAIDLHCDVIVSHHPIIFSGIKKFTPDYYVHRAVRMAIKHDIALYAIHTNLDNVYRNGVNTRICQRLGLRDVRLLRPNELLSNNEVQVGAGMIGVLAEPISFELFSANLKNRMECKLIRHTAQLHDNIKTVAVCGGSGSFLIKDAIKAGADVYISSDIKYHEFFEADGKIVLMDIGHYESEYFTIQLLFDHIKEKFPNFAAHCTKMVTNPVYYH